MRKLILLIFVAALSLAACDKNAEKDTNATAQTSATETAPAEPANTTGNAETDTSADSDTSGAMQADEAAAASDVPAEVEVSPELLDPSKATEQAPATYEVKFSTTQGDFVATIDRKLAPNGADRLYNLVKLGYYDNVAFFRVIDNFMAQFGIHGSPAVNKVWREARIKDDPVKESNTRGMVTFATAGPNTRTSQLCINFKDNSNLDGMGFAPIARSTTQA
jgi:cyclophilin family peptidyl-prolyl cis-trans isomerase